MDALPQALLLSLVAGATIPLGGLLARFERIRPNWLEAEFRHSVIAFGGGALLAAVALVLIPEGSARLPNAATLVAFVAGGVVFMLADRALARRGGAGAQLMAMLLDFIPEAIALGATLAAGQGGGVLLALLIALQNGPEGFNAYREMRRGTRVSARRLLWGFSALALLGPLSAGVGAVWLANAHQLLGAIMVFAAGGILYLIFQDIAPQAQLRRHWGPPLGAVAGFTLGLAGHLLTGG
ncbi:MAG TPA: divalent cation transporter [Alcanivorax sp.]|nr:divalent cation transporter [Alcanivorax sp.]